MDLEKFTNQLEKDVKHIENKEIANRVWTACAILNNIRGYAAEMQFAVQDYLGYLESN